MQTFLTLQEKQEPFQTTEPSEPPRIKNEQPDVDFKSLSSDCSEHSIAIWIRVKKLKSELKVSPDDKDESGNSRSKILYQIPETDKKEPCFLKSDSSKQPTAAQDGDSNKHPSN